MKFKIGDKAEFCKVVLESDIIKFAEITGDFNPVHIDESFATQTRFGARIAHGMMSASFICTVLGMQLPGIGTIHTTQHVEFKKPVYIGDALTVRLEVTEIINEKYLRLSSKVFNQTGDIVIDGYSVVLPPRT